jgi:hypothetical protein
MVAPALQTEGKVLQREQSIGMGATRAATAVPAPPSGDGLVGPGDSPAGSPAEPEGGADPGEPVPAPEPAGAPAGAFIHG